MHAYEWGQIWATIMGIEENKASVEGNIGLLQAARVLKSSCNCFYYNVSCTFFPVGFKSATSESLLE